MVRSNREKSLTFHQHVDGLGMEIYSPPLTNFLPNAVDTAPVPRSTLRLFFADSARAPVDPAPDFADGDRSSRTAPVDIGTVPSTSTLRPSGRPCDMAHRHGNNYYSYHFTTFP